MPRESSAFCPWLESWPSATANGTEYYGSRLRTHPLPRGGTDLIPQWLTLALTLLSSGGHASNDVAERLSLKKFYLRRANELKHREKSQYQLTTRLCPFKKYAEI